LRKALSDEHSNVLAALQNRRQYILIRLESGSDQKSVTDGQRLHDISVRISSVLAVLRKFGGLACTCEATRVPVVFLAECATIMVVPQLLMMAVTSAVAEMVVVT
jgi:hypothetical protein